MCYFYSDNHFRWYSGYLRYRLTMARMKLLISLLFISKVKKIFSLHQNYFDNLFYLNEDTSPCSSYTSGTRVPEISNSHICWKGCFMWTILNTSETTWSSARAAAVKFTSMFVDRMGGKSGHQNKFQLFSASQLRSLKRLKLFSLLVLLKCLHKKDS